MKIASVADVKAKLSAYIKASGSGPVVITRSGKAVAAIIPLSDEEDVERVMLGYSPRLREILAAAKARVRAGHGIEHEQFWQQVESGGRPKRKRRRKATPASRKHP